jgi:type II secretory pathway pseudopilin PulG
MMMTTIRRTEVGDTLIEILIALVVIGLVVSAFFATFSTQASGSLVQRDVVTEDGALRSYAELTKSAVRTQCASGSTFSVSYTPPAGFGVNPLVNQSCPGVTSVSPVTLQIQKQPNGIARSLDIKVRKS